MTLAWSQHAAAAGKVLSLEIPPRGKRRKPAAPAAWLLAGLGVILLSGVSLAAQMRSPELGSLLRK
ncbi:MAG: hypothetical protein V3R29_09580, partial [Candidatus Acidoferrales bacterium]